MEPVAAAEDAALVAGLKAHDERAYETAVRVHGARLLAVARRFLRDERDAQEVVQDAFLSAFRSIDRFQGDSKLSTWLHRIAVNAALQRLRTKKHRADAPIDDLLPSFTEDGHLASPVHAWIEKPASASAEEENSALVRSAIGRLPEPYRLVLLLRDVEGLDTAETAKILGIEESAARVRLHRARLALRSLLDPSLAEDASRA